MKRIVAILLCVCTYSSYAQSLKDSLLHVLRKTPEDTIAIKVYNKLAKINRSDSSLYTQYTTQAIGLASQQKDPWFLANSYHTRGWIELERDNYLSCIRSLDSAIKYYGYASDSMNAAFAYSSKGLCFWKLGQYEKAIKIYTGILSQFEHTHSVIELKVLNNLGLIYMEQERNEEALKAFQKSLKLGKQEKDARSIMLAQNNSSIIYRHQKKFKQAIASLREALRISLNINHKAQIARSYSNMGATFTQMDEGDSAEYYLLKAYQYATKNKLYPGLCKTTWHLAELYERIDRLNEARRYARESLRIAHKNKLTEDIRYAFEILFTIEKKAKNPQLAIQMADSLSFWTDSLNRVNLANEIAAAEANYNNTILRKETELQSSEIKRLDIQRNYLILGIVGTLVLAVLALLLFRSAFIRKRTRRELENEIKHTKKLTESVERYRQKRATELHDDVGQELLLAHQSIELNSSSEESLKFLSRALNKIRKISKDEYPYELNYVGLQRSLEYLIDLVEQNTNLIISESLEGIQENIAYEQRLNIYRIIQEMINNSIKNGKGNSVFIGIKRLDTKLRLTYKDSSAGFDFHSKLNDAQSIGLKSIVNRSRLLGAELKFVPSIEENKYILDIPIRHKSSDL